MFKPSRRRVAQVLTPLALACTVLQNLPAHGQLRLSESFIELDQEHRVRALDVSNDGDETIFVKVSVVEVVDPQGPDPQVLEESDPAKLGLLASPGRLILPPGESRRVRTVSLAAPAKDRYYKLIAEPVVGAIETDQSVGVKILVGYAAWVLVRPDLGTPRLEAVRDNGDLRLKNLGGTFATLRSGWQCATDSTPKTDCTPLRNLHVLIGRESVLELPHGDRPVEYEMHWAGKTQRLHF